MIELENNIRGDFNISLYNVVGQKLYETSVIKGNDLLKHQISALEIPAGTYEVLVKSGDYFGIKKVVVIR